MLHEKESYLNVNTDFSDDSIGIELNEQRYGITYPKNVWQPLEEHVKRSIVDHIAFLSTNYLPLILGKKGIVYDTRLRCWTASLSRT
jgi:hypothetical protein